MNFKVPHLTDREVTLCNGRGNLNQDVTDSEILERTGQALHLTSMRV